MRRMRSVLTKRTPIVMLNTASKMIAITVRGGAAPFEVGFLAYTNFTQHVDAAAGRAGAARARVGTDYRRLRENRPDTVTRVR